MTPHNMRAVEWMCLVLEPQQWVKLRLTGLAGLRLSSCVALKNQSCVLPRHIRPSSLRRFNKRRILYQRIRAWMRYLDWLSARVLSTLIFQQLSVSYRNLYLRSGIILGYRSIPPRLRRLH